MSLSSISRSFFKDVVIYSGHPQHPSFGPYRENVEKRVRMFTVLNGYRLEKGRPPWSVVQAYGEDLIHTLGKYSPETTLLVIPAGQSTHLDQVFSDEQLQFIDEKFLGNGGRLYCNCGSAYWLSRVRVYADLCTVQPSERSPIEKISRLPLFQGKAVGPLCPYPGKQYQVGFFSDAVTVQGKNEADLCTIFLSGGGCFFPEESEQKLQVLVSYTSKELERLRRSSEEYRAAILIPYKKGAVVLSMFHPYYGAQDIDTERYMAAFPEGGTDWKGVHARLSAESHRMNFVLENILFPLEDALADL